MNLFDLISASVERDPDHAAVVFQQWTMSYRDMLSAARRVSATLQRHGVQPSDRVLMYAPNTPEYWPVYLGCAHMGAIFAPVNTAFRARELEYVLPNAQANVAFVHSSVAAEFRELSAAAQGAPKTIIEFEGPRDGVAEPMQSLFEHLSDHEDASPAKAVPADHGALICYTSGTTSTPKPVLHSHASEIFAALGYVAAWRMERSDRGLVTLPLAWIYGLSSAGLALLTAGATVHLMTHFNPERALEAIELNRATIFFGSMSMYVKMVDVLDRRDFKLSSLRLCTNGAEPCPDASVRAFESRAGIRLTHAYALSEARPVVAEDPLDDSAPPGTCGRLVPGATLRLLDEAGHDVPVGAVGEAFIRCPGMLSEYFLEPELTQQRLDADGWLRTGDLVSRDERGYYFVVGRSGDMIIRSGVNISPAEIEDALLEHGQISQAVVVGAPDPVSGQAVFAFIVPRPGVALEQEDIKSHLASRIAQYKMPQRFVVQDDLPTGPSGKLDRAALKAAALKLETPSSAQGDS